MSADSLRLYLHTERYAILRLAPDDPAPEWLSERAPGLTVLARSQSETSITCPQTIVPAAVEAERDWRLLEVSGPLNFDQIGILASLTEPLARARVPVLAVSTYNTDYLLVKEGQLENAISALEAAGQQIEPVRSS